MSLLDPSTVTKSSDQGADSTLQRLQRSLIETNKKLDDAR